MVAFSDGGGQVPSALRPVSGRAKALGGVLGTGLEVSQAEVNGSPAVLLWAEDELFAVFIPVIDAAKIALVYGVTAPGKLAAAGRQARQSRNAALDTMDGVRLNRGPHAIYLGGPGRQVLTRLGVRPAVSPGGNGW